jgi:dihydroflavonol-4-reductase
MTTLLTGASGFIGGVLLRELLDRGRSVRVLIHEDPGQLESLAVDCVSGDICDPASLEAAFDGVDCVFHLASVISLAGDRGGQVTAANVGGAHNMARAALRAGVRRFVHFSSIHSFDLTDTSLQITEESARVSSSHPIYDRTKWAGEQKVREVVAEGLDAVIVHPVGVLGPGDRRPSRIGQVLLDLEARRLPMLIAGGFDWVDVRDVVAGALLAEEKGRTGESYLLSGHWASARELGEIGRDITGVAPPSLDVPMWLASGLAPFGDLWSRLSGGEARLNSDALVALKATRRISHAKASTELGYASRPLRDTVFDSYRWFSEAGMLKAPLAAAEGAP